MNCRFCGNVLDQQFIDLVNSPLSNAFLTSAQLDEPEIYYPLRLLVCEKCHLVQIGEYKKAYEIFHDDYLYFSSYSKSWLTHARNYAAMISERLALGPQNFVIEIASNDGYLLQNFQEANIPCLGIEPTKGTAEVAREKGIEVITDFFGLKIAEQLAAEGRQADLVIGNNVLAHVPDLNDFVGGLKAVLKRGGVINMEFPHLLRLVEGNQFDTIYHEHFSYFSFLTVQRIFSVHELIIFDVEEIPTHGGSLRIYAGHARDASKPVSPSVKKLAKRETDLGMNTSAYYSGFQAKADKIKYDLLSFLIAEKSEGRKVAAYGAAAKGNTLLNYCGVKRDLIEFVVDASPHKQGKYLPGSHIPIVAEEKLQQWRPDYVLILPWNIKEEIMGQIQYIKNWGGRFLVATPCLQVVDV